MVPFAALLPALSAIPDPRRAQGRRYPLAHLLLFSAVAVPAGAAIYRGILSFSGVHRERPDATFGTRLRRAPAVSTPRDLFLAPDPADLEAAFRRHARGLHEAAPRPGRPPPWTARPSGAASATCTAGPPPTCSAPSRARRR